MQTTIQKEEFDVHALNGVSDTIDAKAFGEQAISAAPMQTANDRVWESGGVMFIVHPVRPAVSFTRWTVNFGESVRHYHLVDRVSIDAVMAQADGLRALVDDAVFQLRERFKGDTFILSISVDPDDNSIVTLVLKVKTTKDYDEACKLWFSFNDEWWLPNYDRGQDKLCILLDF